MQQVFVDQVNKIGITSEILAVEVVSASTNSWAYGLKLPWSAARIAAAKMQISESDLVLTSGDQQLIIADWQQHPEINHIVTADDKTMAAQVLRDFSINNQLMVGTLLTETVAVVQQLTGPAWLVDANGQRHALSLSDKIPEGAQIETQAGSRLTIEFSDGEQVVIAGNSRMAINQYFFDSASQSGISILSIIKGIFQFSSGLIARDNPENVSIHTPIAEIGIRGTSFLTRVTEQGEMEIVILEGRLAIATLADKYQLNTPLQGLQITSDQVSNLNFAFSSLQQSYSDLFQTEQQWQDLLDLVTDEVPEITQEAIDNNQQGILITEPDNTVLQAVRSASVFANLEFIAPPLSIYQQSVSSSNLPIFLSQIQPAEETQDIRPVADIYAPYRTMNIENFAGTINEVSVQYSPENNKFVTLNLDIELTSDISKQNFHDTILYHIKRSEITDQRFLLRNGDYKLTAEDIISLAPAEAVADLLAYERFESYNKYQLKYHSGIAKVDYIFGVDPNNTVEVNFGEVYTNISITNHLQRTGLNYKINLHSQGNGQKVAIYDTVATVKNIEFTYDASQITSADFTVKLSDLVDLHIMYGADSTAIFRLTGVSAESKNIYLDFNDINAENGIADYFYEFIKNEQTGKQFQLIIEVEDSVSQSNEINVHLLYDKFADSISNNELQLSPRIPSFRQSFLPLEYVDNIGQPQIGKGYISIDGDYSGSGNLKLVVSFENSI